MGVEDDIATRNTAAEAGASGTDGAPREPLRIHSWQESFSWRFLLPHYWWLWLFLGAASLVAFLPLRARGWLGDRLGDLLLRRGYKRLRIAECNLRYCLPEQDTETLLRDHARLVALGLLQVFVFCLRSHRYLHGMIGEFQGLDYLRKNAAEGRGTLLLSPHHAHAPTVTAVLALGGAPNATILPRWPNNPLLRWFEATMLSRRNGLSDLPARDTMALIGALRKGATVPFYCDQDYGTESSVMSTWFGKPAATLCNAPVIAKRAKAGVAVASAVWDGRRYHILVEPWDEYVDLRGQEAADRMNEAFERHVQRQLHGWLWSYRRFKTRPEGAEDPYEDLDS